MFLVKYISFKRKKATFLLQMQKKQGFPGFSVRIDIPWQRSIRFRQSLSKENF